MQGYLKKNLNAPNCTNTQNTREAWETTQFVTLPLGSDGCLKKNQNRCTRLWGKNKTKKRLGGIKGCKVFKEKSERYITSRNGWVSLKGIFRWYICSVVILHLGTEVPLKGILGGIDVDVILNSIVQIRARLGFWAHTNV